MASGVFTNLDTRHISKRDKLLLADFSYTDRVFGKITAPKDSVTDFASVLTLRNMLLLLLYVVLVGYGDKAATIHDFLYGGGLTEDGRQLTRKESDEVFARALRDEGIASWRMMMFFYGVRFGGADHWKGPKE